jgi:hypothetical protein
MLALDAPAVLQGRMDGRLFAVTAAEPHRARDLLRAHPAVLRAVLFGELLHVVVAPGTRDADLATLPGVRSVRAIDASLEDVFIHLVGEASAGEAAA